MIERLSRAPWTNNFRASSIHTTIPVGPQDQPDYANACAIFETSIDARALMRHLLSIEAECGRSRPDEQRWGPRTLDLDLLLFGDCVLDEPFVTIPHPRMHERLFVLEPLAELCPERMIPGINQTVRDAIERLRTG